MSRTDWEVVIGLESSAQLNTAIQDLRRQHRLRRRAQPPGLRVDIACPACCRCSTRAPSSAPSASAWRSAPPSPQERLRPKNYFYPDLPRATRSASSSCRWWSAARSRCWCGDGKGRRLRRRAPDPRPPRGRRRQEPARRLPRHDRIDLNRAGTPLLEIVSGPTCARRPRPSPTPARCTRWCAGSTSATATCRKAPSAATPTSRCARGQAEFGTRREIRTSTASASCSRPSTTSAVADRPRSGTAARIQQATVLFDPDTGETAPCAARKTPTTTATSPTPTCCRW